MNIIDWEHEGGPPWDSHTRPKNYRPPCGHLHGRFYCTDTVCGYGAAHPALAFAKLFAAQQTRVAKLAEVVDRMALEAGLSTEGDTIDVALALLQPRPVPDFEPSNPDVDRLNCAAVGIAMAALYDTHVVREDVAAERGAAIQALARFGKAVGRPDLIADVERTPHSVRRRNSPLWRALDTAVLAVLAVGQRVHILRPMSPQFGLIGTIVRLPEPSFEGFVRTGDERHDKFGDVLADDRRTCFVVQFDDGIRQEFLPEEIARVLPDAN